MMLMDMGSWKRQIDLRSCWAQDIIETWNCAGVDQILGIDVCHPAIEAGQPSMAQKWSCMSYPSEHKVDGRAVRR